MFADIDGTMTDERDKIPPATVEALARLEEAGIPVVPSSGNAYPIAYTVARYMPGPGWAVGENGGVYGLRGDYRLAAQPIREELRRIVHERLQGVLVESWQNEFRYVDLAFHPARGFTPEEAVERARRVLEPLGYEVLNSGYAIHIHRRGVSKGAVIPLVVEAMGLEDAYIVAIGDSEVDADMFRAADFSIALGNAAPRVKRLAKMSVEKGFAEGFIEAVKVILDSHVK